MPDIEPTASLGKLFIDERNGYIGICKSNRYKANKCTWFKITDIENPGLYCTKPRVNMNNNVLVDCELAFDVPSQGISIKRIVKTRMHCNYRRKNSQYLEWEEPGTISLMRAIIVQTYMEAVQNEIKRWQEQLRFIHDNLREQALCAMMLSENYTQEQLKQRFRALSKIYHPDAGGSTETMQLLNQYYEILKR